MKPTIVRNIKRADAEVIRALGVAQVGQAEKVGRVGQMGGV